MTGRLADTDLVVVARGTVIHDTVMIKYRLGEIRVRDVMTQHTVLVGWNVIKRLASTDHIVVAFYTIVGNTSVIISTGCKSTRCMADIAVLACRHVVVSLTQCVGAVMTGITTSVNHLGEGVIHKSADKTFGVMTIPTIRRSYWMILHLIFPRCIYIIVTGFACHGHGIQH